jgi:transcriptional regulator with XRE-family HTH domain
VGQTRLREVREAKGVRISHLAKLAGVSRNTIYRIEAGYGKCASLQTLEDLAKALDVPLTELLGAA